MFHAIEDTKLSKQYKISFQNSGNKSTLPELFLIGLQVNSASSMTIFYFNIGLPKAVIKKYIIYLIKSDQ